MGPTIIKVKLANISVGGSNFPIVGSTPSAKKLPTRGLGLMLWSLSIINQSDPFTFTFLLYINKYFDSTLI